MTTEEMYMSALRGCLSVAREDEIGPVLAARIRDAALARPSISFEEWYTRARGPSGDDALSSASDAADALRSTPAHGHDGVYEKSTCNVATAYAAVMDALGPTAKTRVIKDHMIMMHDAVQKGINYVDKSDNGFERDRAGASGASRKRLLEELAETLTRSSDVHMDGTPPRAPTTAPATAAGGAAAAIATSTGGVGSTGGAVAALHTIMGSLNEQMVRYAQAGVHGHNLEIMIAEMTAHSEQVRVVEGQYRAAIEKEGTHNPQAGGPGEGWCMASGGPWDVGGAERPGPEPGHAQLLGARRGPSVGIGVRDADGVPVAKDTVGGGPAPGAPPVLVDPPRSPDSLRRGGGPDRVAMFNQLCAFASTPELRGQLRTAVDRALYFEQPPVRGAEILRKFDALCAAGPAELDGGGHSALVARSLLDDLLDAGGGHAEYVILQLEIAAHARTLNEVNCDRESSSSSAAANGGVLPSVGDCPRAAADNGFAGRARSMTTRLLGRCTLFWKGGQGAAACTPADSAAHSRTASPPVAHANIHGGRSGHTAPSRQGTTKP